MKDEVALFEALAVGSKALVTAGPRSRAGTAKKGKGGWRPETEAAIEAAMDLRVVLFHGDLPLRFGIDSHARGSRKGLVREPAVATWDGSLSADFGPAGAFVRLNDLFDRAPGSAIWDPAVPGPAPMPGRNVQAGVSWNLLD